MEGEIFGNFRNYHAMISENIIISEYSLFLSLEIRIQDGSLEVLEAMP